MKHFAFSLALLTCALTPGCFSLDEDGDGLIDLPPESGSEVNAITCADGRDNDYDSRIDCQDSDCLVGAFCGEEIPIVPRTGPERNVNTCTDGIDNDEDGQFDCGDRSCQGIMELCCNIETNDILCSNRLDDDGNGYADCTDFSCRNNDFVRVCESEIQCVKFDDEGNLAACTLEEELAARERQCGDRFDNDGDRRTDCNDDECACTEACNPGCAGPETTLESCRDGFDNDNNGYVDCEDHSCSMNPDQNVADLCVTTGGEPENNPAACTDGVDNDGNGYTDCGDRSCFDDRTDPPSGAAVTECLARQEDTVEKCSDGVDNDGNGFVDCDDNSCRFGEELALRAICESTAATCHDHLDNNDNGFTDCADFSCRFSACIPAGSCGPSGECPSGQACLGNTCITVSSPCREGAYLERNTCKDEQGMMIGSRDLLIAQQQAQTRAGCTDGQDNDLDGFVDCQDWDCNHNPLAVEADGTTPLCRDSTGAPLVCG